MPSVTAIPPTPGGQCLSLNWPGLAGWIGPYHIGTMRMHMRRFTGLTNAFSKKIEMIDASLRKPGKRGPYKIKETKNVV